MNLYNVMVYYEGEGSTNIFVPGIGDTSITHGRPIYIKNADFNVIEALRQFRKMQINIKINADKLGAFRVIDLSEVHSVSKVLRNNLPKEESVTESDISAVLKSGTTGPIVLDTKPVDTTDYGSFVLPSGSYEGKTISEVDKLGKLKSVYNGFKTRNKQVKDAIDNYYKSKVE